MHLCKTDDTTARAAQVNMKIVACRQPIKVCAWCKDTSLDHQAPTDALIYERTVTHVMCNRCADDLLTELYGAKAG